MITKINNKISKIDVTKAADLIAARGEIPTIDLVRVELQGRGSETTIHNYLKEWKKSKLLAKLGSTIANHNQELILIEEKRSLEEALQQQMIKNENYAQELIQAEKMIVALKEENHKLQVINQALKLELKDATAVKATLAQVNQEIQHKIELNNNQIITQQQQLIIELQAELKELNVKSMQAMQELSSSSHEVLMQEKVNSINLQAKIDSLSQELNQDRKQLELEQYKHQTQVSILHKQIKLQQKILQTQLSQEKLQQLEQNGLELLT